MTEEIIDYVVLFHLKRTQNVISKHKLIVQIPKYELLLDYVKNKIAFHLNIIKFYDSQFGISIKYNVDDIYVDDIHRFRYNN